MLLLLILVVVVGITAFDFSSSFRVTACVLGAFLGVGAILAGVGTSLLGKVKRFRVYILSLIHILIITSGDAVYKLDYNKVLEYHIAKKADITVVCKDLEAG